MTTPFSEKLRILRPYAIGGLVSVVGFVLTVLGAYTITHREETTSSDSADSGDTLPNNEPLQLRVNGAIRTILIVEGCEYITRIDTDDGTAYYGLEHRTRCRNPLHHPGMMSNLGWDDTK